MEETATDTPMDINSNKNEPSERYIYQYTGMTGYLTHVRHRSNGYDNDTLWNEETMYHYCNLLLDQYHNDDNEVNIALFRTYASYGPKKKNIDVYFHPFLWKQQWHLAIGFTKYEKILLLNCSDVSYNNDTTNNLEGEPIKFPSFPTKASLRIEQFICFFKQKLSKHSLRYPRLHTDLFMPSTPYNAINLLTVIFSFCFDPISLVRIFCDPQFTPRKFDISDMHPIINEIDDIFMKSYLQMKEQQREKQEMELLLKEKKEAERMKQEKKRIDEKRQLLEQKRKLLEEKQRLKEEEAHREKEQKELQIQEQLKKENDIRQRAQHEKLELLKNQQKRQLAVVDDQSLDTIAKRRKHASATNGSLTTPIEINDLDDDEDEQEVDQDRKDEAEYNKYLNYRLQTTDVKKEREDKLKLVFSKSYAQEFKKNIIDMSLFPPVEKFDHMYQNLELICKNPLTAPDMQTSSEVKPGPQRNEYDIRETLFVRYQRRQRQEFDEVKCAELLKKDSLNQIIPLVYEHGSIYLINIKTTDKFHCIIKCICISNRANRSEREIMKSHAVRRLTEMYVEKYKRLVIKIRTSIIHVKSASFYRVAMQSVFTLHHILWKGKFDLTFNPKNETLENYIAFYEKIVNCTLAGDMFQTELNFKRLTKHVLQDT